MNTKFRKFIAPVIGVLLSMLIIFATAGMASAHSTSNITQPAQTLHITLPHNLQAKFPATQIKPNIAVTPKSVQCQYFERQSHFGTICVTVWEQCVLGVCVTVGVDINLSQGLVDYIASAGSIAVSAIVGAIAQSIPALQPFSSGIQAVINFSISTIVNFAKAVCGGTGVGMNIGFPDALSLHC